MDKIKVEKLVDEKDRYLAAYLDSYLVDLLVVMMVEKMDKK